ncbi:MAG: type II toxin-antitoxin system RelE/ParE family toxin [Deltaproteobacteria bacterium]|nr:type II toxin-antitoxin system RelE/ParE family toxin [Deltaproteobacteria bacterium]
MASSSRYRVELTARAERDLEQIGDAKERARLLSRLAGLCADPRPPGSVKLSGTPEAYRIRQGNYRIVYHIRDAVRVVAVVRIGHRREVYR